MQIIGLQDGGESANDDFLNRMFGGFFNGMGGMGGPSSVRRPSPEVIQHPVDLADLYNGNIEIPVTAKKLQKLCKECDGRGGKEGAAKQCTTCHGTGTKVRDP